MLPQEFVSPLYAGHMRNFHAAQQLSQLSVRIFSRKHFQRSQLLIGYCYVASIEQRYFQEEEALHNDHIGLDNVLRRLHLFYGKDFRFSLRSQENHYTVITLYIPNFPSEPSR